MSDRSTLNLNSRRKPVFAGSLWSFVDIDLLVYFRVVFGSVMLYWVVKYCHDDLVTNYYVNPRLHLHYFGFDWVRPWPGSWMIVHFYGLGLCAALIILGCVYRLASLLFAVGFTHVFLIDKCFYLNHYYLVCLVAWVMVLLPANRAGSIDAFCWPRIRADHVPAWSLWLMRFHVGIPYFYGGIAKLNPDWLAGEPMRMMLRERASYPVVGPFFTEEWCVQLFVWGGLLFDLLVVPLLLWARSRPFAFVLAICFHLMNAWLFTIGIFPWFMMLATVVFFPPGSIRTLLRRGQPKSITPTTTEHNRLSLPQKALMGFILAYVVIQLTVPLRHFFQPGNPSWTEEGHYFSWHMMLRGKRSALRYYATDPRTGRTGTIDLRNYVTPFQMNRCSRDPRMIHELSQFIADDLRKLGFPNAEIRALSLVSLNGRKPQLMIDPRINLAAEELTWKQPRWIVPLHEPLRAEPWDAPLSEWEKLVLGPSAAD